jgi:hypothetical protein
MCNTLSAIGPAEAKCCDVTPPQITQNTFLGAAAPEKAPLAIQTHDRGFEIFYQIDGILFK